MERMRGGGGHGKNEGSMEHDAAGNGQVEANKILNLANTTADIMVEKAVQQVM